MDVDDVRPDLAQDVAHAPGPAPRVDGEPRREPRAEPVHRDTSRVLDRAGVLATGPEGRGEDVDVVPGSGLCCGEVADLRLDPARPGAKQSVTWTMRMMGRLLARRHSHSMVPGGLLVTSSTTRFTSLTSLVMRVEMTESTS
ncbi:hypothetical protein GCM10025865_04020 [Paraoerskovia sediminicola]|uniref:Uncharacterized protein n=1 Tax=Paraoerskovia sediminicola TaxID=1138587 RepID=A0ABN6XA71_9CELL|nr:hypothetical protein GCM10025865_04020 [Paraoerskovia sediminicola]